MSKEQEMEYTGKGNPKIVLKDWEFCSPFKCPFSYDIVTLQKELEVIKQQMEIMKKLINKKGK